MIIDYKFITGLSAAGGRYMTFDISIRLKDSNKI